MIMLSTVLVLATLSCDTGVAPLFTLPAGMQTRGSLDEKYIYGSSTTNEMRLTGTACESIYATYEAWLERATFPYLLGTNYNNWTAANLTNVYLTSGYSSSDFFDPKSRVITSRRMMSSDVLTGIYDIFTWWAFAVDGAWLQPPEGEDSDDDFSTPQEFQQDDPYAICNKSKYMLSLGEMRNDIRDGSRQYYEGFDTPYGKCNALSLCLGDEYSNVVRTAGTLSTLLRSYAPGLPENASDLYHSDGQRQWLGRLCVANALLSPCSALLQDTDCPTMTAVKYSALGGYTGYTAKWTSEGKGIKVYPRQIDENDPNRWEVDAEIDWRSFEKETTDISEIITEQSTMEGPIQYWGDYEAEGAWEWTIETPVHFSDFGFDSVENAVKLFWDDETELIFTTHTNHVETATGNTLSWKIVTNEDHVYLAMVANRSALDGENTEKECTIATAELPVSGWTGTITGGETRGLSGCLIDSASSFIPYYSPNDYNEEEDDYGWWNQYGNPYAPFLFASGILESIDLNVRETILTMAVSNVTDQAWRKGVEDWEKCKNDSNKNIWRFDRVKCVGSASGNSGYDSLAKSHAATIMDSMKYCVDRTISSNENAQAFYNPFDRDKIHLDEAAFLFNFTKALDGHSGAVLEKYHGIMDLPEVNPFNENTFEVKLTYDPDGYQDAEKGLHHVTAEVYTLEGAGEDPVVFRLAIAKNGLYYPKGRNSLCVKYSAKPSKVTHWNFPLMKGRKTESESESVSGE